MCSEVTVPERLMHNYHQYEGASQVAQLEFSISYYGDVYKMFGSCEGEFCLGRSVRNARVCLILEA
jgi:hypothetical protein